MKERLINIIKWFLIILGILFLFQILLAFLAFFGLSKLDEINFDSTKIIRPKEIQQVINYIEQYKKDNGSYPDNLDNLKKKKDFEYKYELSDDKKCYTVTIKSEKDNTTKQYQRCSSQKDNINSNSESYIEFNN